MKRPNILIITQTGLAIALIVLAQLVGKIFPAGAIVLGPLSFNQLLTGSLINMVFVILVLRAGIIPAITAGIVSSIMALMLGIGPIFPQIVPVIAASNIIFACTIFLINMLFNRNRNYSKTDQKNCVCNKTLYLFFIVALAALAKFIFLKLCMPPAFDLIKEITPVQRDILSIMFSWPQLVTALIGGIMGIIIFSIIKIDAKPTD